MPPKRPLKDRFFDKVRYNPTTGCMEWTASTTGGYGQIGEGGRGTRNLRAHRVRYSLETGLEIPDGIEVRHYVCNNPRCVTFAHLVLGTSEDNGADMVMWGRQAKGEKQGNAHAPDDVKERVIEAYATGAFSQRELAAEVGVSQKTISNWVRGVTRSK